MTGQRSIARMTALVFVAAGVRELALLPSRIARKSSWISWCYSQVIDGLAKLTTETGLFVSNFVRTRSCRRKGFVRVGQVPVPEAVEPDFVQPVPEVEERKPVRARPSREIDRSLVDRKLWLLSRSGLFGDDTLGAEIDRACTLEDLRKAYMLVHDVYLGTGFIEPVTIGMRLRIFEMTPDMATFVAKVDGKVVGVLGVVEDTAELGLPSDASFKDELDSLRASGKRLCEITNQAVALDYRKSAVPTELMRCAIAHITAMGFDQAIATVSPSHSSFYDLAGFREFGSERSYSQKLHDPVVCLSMETDQFRTLPDGLNETERFMHHFLGPGNHFLSEVKGWAKEAQRHFLDPELLAQLFVSERSFVVDCTAWELEGLHVRWGPELFCEVSSDLFIPSTETLIRAAMPALFGGTGATVASGQN